MNLKKILSWLEPTVPKIVLYTILSFIVPTYVYYCQNNICSKWLTVFAGYFLLTNKENAQLSFSMMLLMFIMAYIASSLTIKLFNILKQKLINQAS